MAFRLLVQQGAFEELKSMRDEVKRVLASPAKYLDAELTAEPSSGRTLFERWDDLCRLTREHFADLNFACKSYKPDDIGRLRRSDLESLGVEIQALITAIEPMAN